MRRALLLKAWRYVTDEMMIHTAIHQAGGKMRYLVFTTQSDAESKPPEEWRPWKVRCFQWHAKWLLPLLKKEETYRRVVLELPDAQKSASEVPDAQQSASEGVGAQKSAPTLGPRTVKPSPQKSGEWQTAQAKPKKTSPLTGGFVTPEMLGSDLFVHTTSYNCLRRILQLTRLEVYILVEGLALRT